MKNCIKKCTFLYIYKNAYKKHMCRYEIWNFDTRVYPLFPYPFRLFFFFFNFPSASPFTRACNIYGFHGWNLYPSLVTCQSTRLQSYDYYNEVHNPLSRLLEEQHMYQTCLCSTILWPLLQLRQPSHTWMKIKENWAASNVFFFLFLSSCSSNFILWMVSQSRVLSAQ